jgi:hypothetical protein
MRLYFVDLTDSRLYRIGGAKAKRFLLIHPNWNKLNADDEELIKVRLYFIKTGDLVASASVGNIMATYT